MTDSRVPNPFLASFFSDNLQCAESFRYRGSCKYTSDVFIVFADTPPSISVAKEDESDHDHRFGEH